MKLAIIHLTDIHADETFEYAKYAEQISIQVANSKCDKIVCAISGDLASSGSQNQYDIIDNFCKCLKSRIHESCDKEVRFVFVPGNHDIVYQDGETRNKSVLKKMESDVNYLDNLPTELSRFSNYFNLCEKYGVPCNSNADISIPYFDEQFGNNIVRFYLLNNVAFSTFKDENDESSIGSVNIPKVFFDSIESLPNTINLLLMHFPVFYLNEYTRENLKSVFPYLSYVLCGHIHESEQVAYYLEDGEICPVSTGMALSNERERQLGLSILFINDETKNILRTIYVFDRHKKILYTQQKPILTSFRLMNGINPLMKDDSFCKKINHVRYENLSLMDSYVFPEFDYVNDSNSEKKIRDFDQFIKVVNDKKIIIVNGYSQAGKTSLLSFLFHELDFMGIPILIDLDNKNYLNDDNCEQFVKTNVENEYMDDCAWNIFESTPIEQRIALIDNVLYGEDFIKQIELLEKHFGKIIVTVKESRFLSKDLSQLASNKYFAKKANMLSLRPMFYKKRAELIDRRCRAIALLGKRTISDEEIHDVATRVENILGRYVGSDSNYPYFINKVITSVFQEDIDQSSSSQKMYSSIYEIYIGQIIASIFVNKDENVVALKALQTIGFGIIFNEQLCLPKSETIGLINQYLNDKKITVIDPYSIVSKLEDGKILSSSNQKISFVSSDFLAYFAAKHLSSLLDDDFDKNKTTIDFLLDNIFDDVYEKVLLFLASICGKRISSYLIEKAESFVSQFEDFEITGEAFATKDEEFKYIKALSKKEKKAVEEKRHVRESKRYDNEEKTYEKDVSIGKKKISDKEQKDYYIAIGFLDLVSSLIPDLKPDLDFAYQDRLIVLLYRLPQIICHIDKAFINANFDLIVEQLHDKLISIDINVEKDVVKSILIDYCRSSFLSAIHYATSRAHTLLTEKDLMDKKYASNDTKRLIRLMSMLFDDNPESSFEVVSKDYFQYFALNPFARNCISLMVRTYVTWYLPETKAIEKRDYLKLFFKDHDVIEDTIRNNLSKND